MSRCITLVADPGRPPQGFEPLGDLLWARMSKPPDWLPGKGHRTGRQAMGIRYERKVHEELLARYGAMYLPSPWFVFQEQYAARPRFCQPDGLLIDIEQGRIIIIEVKYQHTAAAWWQLWQKYMPLVRRAFSPDGEFSIICCEVCRWFDPATRVPQQPLLCPEVHLAARGEFNVHIWRP